MSTELFMEPDRLATYDGDPGRSLCAEVTKLTGEVAALRDNVQQLCQAVRGLVQLQSISDRKLDQVLKAGGGNEVGFGVI